MGNIIIFLVTALFIVFSILLSKYFYKKRVIKKLNDQWGKLLESAYNLDTAKLYWQFNTQPNTANSYAIDEETWKDLNMDELFEVMNRATTPIGSQILFHMLHYPLANSDELERREKIINLFANNTPLRQSVQIFLLGLAKVPAKFLACSLWTPIPQKPKYAFVFYLISAISFWLPVFCILNLIPWAFVLLLFVTNSIIYSLYEKKLAEFVVSFQFLSLLIANSHKIANLLPDELGYLKTELKNELKHTKSISKKVYSLQLNDSNPLVAIYNTYTLAPITGFLSAIGSLKKSIKSLQRIFEIVGYIDSLIAVASYRKQFSNFCNPVFSSSQIFSVSNISHPLVVEPVANNFTFDTKCLLVTGSNMSGKSTFLKTLGVNAILSQTLNMCFASKYEAPFIHVISSIERSDDLINGKSYYMSEVESILRIVNASQTEVVHLFLIDEIFRGTNSVERTASSIEVLQFLNNQKDFVIVATHDLQLTDILSTSYRNFHFRETMTNSGLSFDYKLHPGKCSSKNAIALLKYVGYPSAIVNGASQRVNID